MTSIGTLISGAVVATLLSSLSCTAQIQGSVSYRDPSDVNIPVKQLLDDAFSLARKEQKNVLTTK